MPDPRVFSVSELQRAVRLHLEEEFGSVWVEGEVSNFRPHFSGHLYFTLKDRKAQLGAVMWRSDAQRLKFELEDGLAVRARGFVTVYEAQGRHQLNVRRLEPVGTGPLQLKFDQLRRRLEAEGLFDPDRKRPLPAFPRRVALVTSPTGAAVRDLIHVACRRWPPVRLTVVPVPVQGAGVAPRIAHAIRAADAMGFDVMVVGRGGGSLEDLWAFNEEEVARAIADCTTPVVSAVGHEVDVTISDLVADRRAATPSAAAELVTPDAAELRQGLGHVRRRLARGLTRTLDGLRARLAHVRQARAFVRPGERFAHAARDLDALADRVGAAVAAGLRRRRTRLDRLAAQLDALSPLRVLARGYSVTRRNDGTVVTRAADVAKGDELRTMLHEGEIRSRVT